MTGLPRYNFDEFLMVGSFLKRFGWEVRNPAQRELDRGFDPDSEMTQKQLADAIVWDLQQVMEVDEVLVLPGWKKSKGAITEVALAQWLGKDVREVSIQGFGGDIAISISNPIGRIKIK
jgi:hypothetical protein